MPGLVKRPDCHGSNAPVANHSGSADHDAPLVIDEEDNEAAAEGDMNNALGSRNNGDNLVIHNRINQGQGHNLNARPYKATSSNGGGGGGGGTRSALFPMPPPPAPRYLPPPPTLPQNLSNRR